METESSGKSGSGVVHWKHEEIAPNGVRKQWSENVIAAKAARQERLKRQDENDEARKRRREPGELDPDILAKINRYRRRLAQQAVKHEFDDGKFRILMKRIRTLLCCVEKIDSGFQLDRMRGFMESAEAIIPGMKIAATKPVAQVGEETMDPEMIGAARELMGKAGDGEGAS